MDLVNNLVLGFGAALSVANIGYCLLGVFLGTLIGVLPGLGPLATIAMLLPISYGLEPLSALVLLAGVYYGAQYGGSTTAILVNLPGEASSVVTCLDGHQMALAGRGGAALAIAAIGSFAAGTVGIALLAAFASPLTELAIRFGPAEYFALMILGLLMAVALAKGSPVSAIAMIIVGMLAGVTGVDVNSGTARFTFNLPELSDGISTGAIALAMFGIGDIMANLESQSERTIVQRQVGRLLPSWAELRDSFLPIVRGTGLGSVLGVLPGGGAVLASFAAYTLEKKLSATPGRFGQGAIEGVASPEAANNAAAQTSFVPLLTLGLPGNAVMALMVSAMMIHNIQPGPQVMSSDPALFWGLIASMWIGNLFLVLLNLPLIGIWVRLLTIPYRLLYPAILLFCCIGVYSLSNSSFDIILTAGLSVTGYLLAKLGCEITPMLLGFVLGPMLEEYLRRALILSRGDPAIFLERPISLGLLLASLLILVILAMPTIRRSRDKAFVDAG